METELKRAMTLHSKLLADCMDLQVKADEVIRKFKYSRLRNAFDFTTFLESSKEHNNTSTLTYLIQPFFSPFITKTFSFSNINDVLTYQPAAEEVGETLNAVEEQAYVFDDELEEERIADNYGAMIKVMMSMLSNKNEFTLAELNDELLLTFFDDIFKNSDYYSFLVHLCQKKKYQLKKLMLHQDTFFDAILVEFLKKPENKKYIELDFHLELSSDIEPTLEDQELGLEQILHKITLPEKETEFITSNFTFVRDLG